MDSIYSNADLTIIAACGKTVYDGLAGLYHPRRPQQAYVRVNEELSLIGTNITSAAYRTCEWRNRGWCLQERLCSRRALVFTDDQVYWSCPTADWCESLCLEPMDSIPLCHAISKPMIGCYEPGEIHTLARFDHAHLRSLIFQYTSRKLTNESDALDAFAGLLRRFLAVTSTKTYWGHTCTSRFGESLAWISESGTRRTELCPVRQTSGNHYQVSFPSWSWLGWCGPAYDFRNDAVAAISELEFYALAIDGNIKRLVSSSNWSLNADIDMSRISEQIARSWKGQAPIDFNPAGWDDDFKDSGRLLFWTSHARLQIKQELRYSSMDSNSTEWKLYSSIGLEVGSLKGTPIPAEWHENEFSFVVVSRMYVEDKRLRALPRLNVLMITWDDLEAKIASRLSSGIVDEDGWVKAEREWILLTLQ
jgi:hypothetical protein